MSQPFLSRFSTATYREAFAVVQQLDDMAAPLKRAQLRVESARRAVTTATNEQEARDAEDRLAILLTTIKSHHRLVG